MSLPDNLILDDLREALGSDSITPEMEDIVGVMRSMRPRVEIDR